MSHRLWSTEREKNVYVSVLLSQYISETWFVCKSIRRR